MTPRRQAALNEQRKREALRPLRNAVNQALRKAGLPRARLGSTGHGRMSLIRESGFATESSTWGQHHGIEVRLETRTPSISETRTESRKQADCARSIWEGCVAALKADARFRVVELGNQRLLVVSAELQRGDVQPKGVPSLARQA